MLGLKLNHVSKRGPLTLSDNTKLQFTSDFLKLQKIFAYIATINRRAETKKP